MPKRAWIYLQQKPPQLVGFELSSVDSQRHACENYCAQQGLSVVGESVDLGRFGPRQRRPGLDQALAAAEARAFDVLVTPRPQRLPREATPFQRLLEALEQASAELRFGEPDSPSPTDHLTQLRAEEQADREHHKEQLAANLRLKNRLQPTPKPPPKRPNTKAQTQE